MMNDVVPCGCLLQKISVYFLSKENKDYMLQQNKGTVFTFLKLFYLRTDCAEIS